MSVIFAIISFVIAIGCFFAGAIGPGIGFLLLAWICAQFT